ncbi:MAG: UPF0149 family protein [Lysobacteraceae bacterium]
MTTPRFPDLELPDRVALDAEISALGLGVDAVELHGSLCGLLCGGGGEHGDWLQALALEPSAAPPPDGALAALREATIGQLDAQDFEFVLLLPDEDAPLGERAEALALWCRGFLGGFGLAASRPSALSDEASEALEDIGKIGSSNLSYDEDEADEQALAEIIEFVRVAALLIHGDCVLAAHHRSHLH